MLAWLALCTAGAATVEAAGPSLWGSPATGVVVTLRVLEPSREPRVARPPVVFYVTGLAAPRIGTEPDTSILAALRSEGNLVVVVDYAGAPAARWPQLNRDIFALRQALGARRLLPEREVDLTRSFVVPSGHRLRRDVVFARDGNRALAMDILYPSRPAKPVGAVIEFSCDNQNRMGNGSLVSCSDTMVEGAATLGYIAAMADHPVPAPYKGLDPMPQCAQLIKAGVRTLRAESAQIGGNGRIVPVGFSRGSGMALMLVTTAGRVELEGVGNPLETNSDVQGAVVMSGRFTYLDLLETDHMIPRYVRAWGGRAANEAVWRRHGALDYLSGPTVPLFLTINRTEEVDAQHQMKVLRRRLADLGSKAEYIEDPEPRGHKVPLHPAVLEGIRTFLRDRLEPSGGQPDAASPRPQPPIAP